MEKVDLEKYFDGNHQYYEVRILVTILKDILGKDLNTIKNDVNNAKIVVTDEEIRKFLDEKFEEEDLELKRRLEKPITKMCLLSLNDEEIKEHSQRFGDELDARRYSYDDYTLKYFKRYSTIVKEKAKTLLMIIEEIVNYETITIQNILDDLDVELKKGYGITFISKEDISRLIIPTIYNINTLNEVITKSNDLSTYLKFKMSLHSVYKNGGIEGELYPTTSLQIKDLYYDSLNGNVPLSKRQSEELMRSKQRLLKNQTVYSFFEDDIED